MVCPPQAVNAPPYVIWFCGGVAYRMVEWDQIQTGGFEVGAKLKREAGGRVFAPVPNSGRRWWRLTRGSSGLDLGRRKPAGKMQNADLTGRMGVGYLTHETRPWVY